MVLCSTLLMASGEEVNSGTLRVVPEGASYHNTSDPLSVARMLCLESWGLIRR